jgi:hypothetical protein
MMWVLISAICLAGCSGPLDNNLRFPIAYEDMSRPSADVEVLFFDESNSQFVGARRDDRSIEVGQPDVYTRCVYGSYCIVVPDIPFPIVIFDSNNSLLLDGANYIVSRDVSLAPACDQYNISYNDKFQSYLYCEGVGIVELKVAIGNTVVRHVFLRSFLGLASELGGNGVN